LKIDYPEHRFDKATGFYYVGLHGFLFPLVLTWEKLVGSLVNYQSDYFFKAISGVYSFLVISLFYLFNRKFFPTSRAVIHTLLLLFTYGFFIVSLRFHIDTARLFFFIVSTLFFMACIRTDKASVWILAGACFGIQAYGHSLGVFLSIIALATLTIFSKVDLVRFKLLSIAGTCMIAFGGIHYIIDIFWGTGWILKDIKFY
jgi:hypothetical protein